LKPSTWFYSGFGLQLAANRAVPGLTPIGPCVNPDTRIWFLRAPALPAGTPEEPYYRSPFLEQGQPALTVWSLDRGAFLRWRYSDGTEFVVARSGSDVWVSWASSSTLEDAVTYLLGPIASLVLRLRGVTSLHASAVAIGDRAIALLGPPHCGKSTTAAMFGRMGYPVLTDDVAPLVARNGAIRVEPTYPQLRLWPDSVAMLCGHRDALPPLTPNWDKRALALGAQFQPHPLPLAAVYVLGERRPGAAARVEGLRGHEALATLAANTCVNYLLTPSMRAREFGVLTRLASTVPVRRILPPAQEDSVTTLCSHILEDYSAIEEATAAVAARASSRSA
jgi:hypothetical protein